VVMPGYWFLYNMYALARNASKYPERDRRIEKEQPIEYDFLAPDSVNEMFHSLELMAKYTGRAYAKKKNRRITENEEVKAGTLLLEEENKELADLEILASGFENSHRKVQLIKVPQAYLRTKELIVYYGISQLLEYVERHQVNSWEKFLPALPKRIQRTEWKNVGGQLMPATEIDNLIKNVKNGKIRDWETVHRWYAKNGSTYEDQKFQHALASLFEVSKLSIKKMDRPVLKKLLQEAVATKQRIVKNIYESRAKDYNNEFRKMAYRSDDEMNKVLGKLEENAFINQQKEQLAKYKKTVAALVRSFRL